MDHYILGGGVTGLAAGMASGHPVFEAEPVPGGICASYYVRPHDTTVLHQRPADGEAYHFEVGGGHWIFGGDRAVLHLIETLTPVRQYARNSAIYFPDRDLYADYPLQDSLRALGSETAQTIVAEMEAASTAKAAAPPRTMTAWLRQSFGPTLSDLFFEPFNELYTAGLCHEIAPQDAYKSPVNLVSVREGAKGRSTVSAGYNTRYLYPDGGLDSLARELAARAHVEYGCRAERIDPRERCVHFSDGSKRSYSKLTVTLPLNKVLEMTGLDAGMDPDPHTSVLVLNIGATRGTRCPDAHWIYVPRSDSGFHRVGFYSNVDPLFLPMSSRERNDRVSIYVERAFPGGQKPSQSTIDQYCRDVTRELQAWGYIGETEVVHPTWIDVAYTWSRPGSKWVPTALDLLQQQDIHMTGRYARWHFQGIADSIRDGLIAGSAIGAATRSASPPAVEGINA